ncbi:transporter substrate-binding domain-containing protein [Pseudomonas sp. SA3-5]|uniref:Transporter substrate-binding domain-containing protein n=1 Tax=Pseudomonas aestuarii TaxID=3018340 RepID=A0ABT4XIH9_9PSED|nr:transporter substrate-binding domain-containing protein [Pseudomonas aestuarii]MDA7088029.1 transporter substrate-binding domain-containing protein [Pseudomonas aestuarii]
MRLRPTIWFALLLVTTCASSHADSIRAVTEDTAYSYLQDGRVAGPATRVVEAMLQRAGLNDYSLTLYPWARAYDMALQQPNVLIYLIARTPEREPLFKWVGEIMRIDYHLYKLREQPDVQVHSLADAKHFSIGVLRDDVRQKYLQAEGFTKLVVAAGNRDNFRRLLNRQVQLVPMPERDAMLLSAEAGVDYASLEQVYTLDALSSDLYMAYSNSTDDETLSRSRAAFDGLKREGLLTRLMDDKAEH